MKKITIYFILFFASLLNAQIIVDKIEPPNWWTGMKHNNIQLMLYGKNLNIDSASSESPGITIIRVHNIENKSYTFIDIEITENAKPGNYNISLQSKEDEMNFIFPLYEREVSPLKHKGFSSSDVVYLITPDRFANGDELNDNHPDLFDKLNPDNPYGRHGGDIQGIINNIDYLKELGITAIWLNPLLENNTRVSYHGYAATNLYLIDRRFGTNELFKKLVEECHKNSIKVIMDHVNNHIGSHHYWVRDLPLPDWFNGTPDNHFLSNHDKVSITDIHSTESVRRKNTDGWFVSEMPDMNQKNPFVAKYLIQNTIWWIEFSGIDGIREDTYPYPDQKYLSEWAAEIFYEYPEFNIVGETWVLDASYLAPYQKGNIYKRDFDTNLPSLMDFPLLGAIWDFTENKGIESLYKILSKDHLYSDPNNLMIFADNHDVERLMYNVDGDINRFRMIMTFLLTTRGIPQIYYGTEIGMLGGKGHGATRANFPGGFPGDARNAFVSSGRTVVENELFEWFKTILKIRKEYKSLSMGSLIHYQPENGAYFYFRILSKGLFSENDEKILVVLNNSDKKQKISLPEEEFIKDTRYLVNLLTDEETKPDKIEIDSYNASIYLLRK
jgi:glycosidase